MGMLEDDLEQFPLEYDNIKRTYLGDGLHAEFDGFGIKLYCDREDGEHWVYLEPFVYHELIYWVKELRSASAKPNTPTIPD